MEHFLLLQVFFACMILFSPDDVGTIFIHSDWDET